MITFLAIAFLVHVISRSIAFSVESIGEVAQAIADGDLDNRSHIRTQDVLGRLAKSINRMAGNLQETIGRMRVEAEHDTFSSQLVDAMEMAHNETDSYAMVAHGMKLVSESHAMELLLSDSSRANLERATQHPLEGAPGCNVSQPFECAAVRRGTAVSFPDSDALNACPRMRGRPGGRISAVCMPVTFMGHSLGVLHATGSVEKPLSTNVASQLAVLGGQAGNRIGTIRAFQRSQVQAFTDSLTGLLNRRSVEESLRELLVQRQSFAFVMADIDHFKKLNDAHGHQAGDNALRVFSEVLRAAKRDGDIMGRWGGEEFVFILPNASAAQGVVWCNRISELLGETLANGKSIMFTVSFGVADSTMSLKPEELQRIADAALYLAKDGGRNQAMMATAANVGQSQPRHGTEHHAGIDLNDLAQSA